MQKYEFCQLTYGRDSQLARAALDGWDLIQVRANTRRGDRTDDDAVARTLAELGHAGWQLVNVENGTYYFQRLVP